MSQTPSQEFEIQFKEFYHKEDQVMIYVKVQLLKSQEKCFLQEENNLQPLGGGNKKHTARAIAPEEVDVLFKSNYFGDSSPLSLQSLFKELLSRTLGHYFDFGRDFSVMPS